MKAAAESNILAMLVTLDVSRLSGWLKVVAKKNMACMLVTRAVSKVSG